MCASDFIFELNYIILCLRCVVGRQGNHTGNPFSTRLRSSVSNIQKTIRVCILGRYTAKSTMTVKPNEIVSNIDLFTGISFYPESFLVNRFSHRLPERIRSQ